ncbi:MAG: sulfite exporter TauE/SafE family protein [Weeksellaceae bacterium]
MPEINLLTIFLTGLFTGGLTCMAVQGGLLATTMAQRAEEQLKSEAEVSGNAGPIIVFLIAKLLAYTGLGVLLGWFGSLFELSLSVQFVMQFVVAIFMIGVALNMLEVHPIFRYFVIQPPRFLTKLVRKQSKSTDVIAPAMLGAFTVFIPCGTTQAMMALAIVSGSPLLGAAILFAFVLGTAPIFFLLGYFTTTMSSLYQQNFLRFAAVAIIVLAVFNLNNALGLVGVTTPLSKLYPSTLVADTKSAQTEATIEIQSQGYAPSSITVKSGSHITLNLVNKGSYTCAAAFTIPSLGIQTIVNVGTTQTVEFDTPNNPTQIPFMCSMGMYRGVINVI